MDGKCVCKLKYFPSSSHRPSFNQHMFFPVEEGNFVFDPIWITTKYMWKKYIITPYLKSNSESLLEEIFSGMQQFRDKIVLAWTIRQIELFQKRHTAYLKIDESIFTLSIPMRYFEKHCHDNGHSPLNSRICYACQRCKALVCFCGACWCNTRWQDYYDSDEFTQFYREKEYKKKALSLYIANNVSIQDFLI